MRTNFTQRFLDNCGMLELVGLNGMIAAEKPSPEQLLHDIMRGTAAFATTIATGRFANAGKAHIVMSYAYDNPSLGHTNKYRMKKGTEHLKELKKFVKENKLGIVTIPRVNCNPNYGTHSIIQTALISFDNVALCKYAVKKKWFKVNVSAKLKAAIW